MKPIEQLTQLSSPVDTFSIRLFSSMSIFPPLYESWFAHHKYLAVLPSIKFDNSFYFEPPLQRSALSIVVMREYLTDREPQEEWFIRVTEKFIASTSLRTLIIVFSRGDDDENATRKKLYTSLIPHTKIEYFQVFSKPTQDVVVKMNDLTNAFIKSFECEIIQQRLIVQIISLSQDINMLLLFQKVNSLSSSASNLVPPKLKWLEYMNEYLAATDDEKIMILNRLVKACTSALKKLKEQVQGFQLTLSAFKDWMRQIKSVVFSLIEDNHAPRKCKVCGKACETRCPKCNILFYCTDDHRNQDLLFHKFYCDGFTSLDKMI